MTDTGHSLCYVSSPPGCGYGDAAREYVKGLKAGGVAVDWQPLSSPSARQALLQKCLNLLPQSLQKILGVQRVGEKGTAALLIGMPLLDNYAQLLERSAAKSHFAYVAWELSVIRPEWLPVLNRLDGLFVPCEFNRKSFIEAGVSVPVTVIPHIAREIQSDVAGRQCLPLSPPAEDFVFYCIGTWTTRKAMEETVRAYLGAFTSADSVTLILKTGAVDEIARCKEGVGDWPAYSVAWTIARLIAEHPNPARILVLSEYLSAEAIDSLHRRGDCYISLTHSEGWGLGAFDALIHDNPVIITGFGGQLDYLGKDYPLLVDYKLEAVACSAHAGDFAGLEHAQWAKADERHAVQLMRSVFESPQLYRQATLKQALWVRQQFSAEQVCADMGRCLGVSQ